MVAKSKYMNRFAFPVFLYALFCFFGCSEKNDPVCACDTINALLDSSATVVVGRVIDGDTFNFGIGKDSFSVRILGIDAFETQHGARLDSQAIKAGISIDSAYILGKSGKLFADSLLSKKKVLLVRDYSQDNFDNYSRILRHVYYYQGDMPHDFGSLMINKGFALTDTL